MKKENKNSLEKNASGITRKEAIKKMGKYAALTAIGTFMILNPRKAQAQSPSNPGTGFFNGGGGSKSWSKPSFSKPSFSKPSASKTLKSLK